MIARIISSAVMGIDANLVEVEVDISKGLPSFFTVGLPEGAVRESKDRVRSAIKKLRLLFPCRQNYCQSCSCRYQKGRNSF